MSSYGGWALVTGASMGLGEAFARELAAQDVPLVLVALEQDRLASLAEELKGAHGVECRILAADLTEDAAFQELEALTADIEVGLLVNNAGIGAGGDFVTRDPGRVAAAVKLNCLAPLRLTRHYLPAMKARGRGGVIFVGSLMSFISAPYEATYCGTKAFNRSLAEALSAELRGTGVDVLALCPAGMRTAFYAADGIRDSDVDRLLRFSDPPGKLARLGLRALGRRPVASPWFTGLVRFLVRLAPRRLAIEITRAIMRGAVRYH